MGLITVTEVESLRRCGWQHEFNSPNKMHLEAANPLESLWLGSLWHRTLDSIAQRATMEDPYHKFVAPNPLPTNIAPEKILCTACNLDAFAHSTDPLAAHSGHAVVKIQEHYRKQQGVNPQQYELKKTYELIEMAQAMLRNYLSYYNNRLLPPDFRYIQTEQQLFKVLPNTEHCTCYLQAKCNCGLFVNNKRVSCRYVHGWYGDCKCGTNNRGTSNVTTIVVPVGGSDARNLFADTSRCRCRKDHILEGKLDGLIEHEPTNNIYVIDHKTFTVHTSVEELRRNSQFMGYTWMGDLFDVKGMIYNGVWVRDHVPNGRTIHDLFVRHTLSWNQYELLNWATQTGIDAMRLFDPRYIPTRTVHPVGGCVGVNNCSYRQLCDARFLNQNYETILRTQYRKREDDSELPMFGM